ncbi:MAG: hypothetical protein COA84_13200 [Robiginitomaculum sp.]|nr:MAG: hypothetical protein COA84_13200 [Robiginitomaculum sp.]
MAQPTTRVEFREWCLRKLGKPVIEINVDATQIEDRIDESLSFYWDYHFDGSQKTYLKYTVTQLDIDNRYITVPESILGAIRMFPMSKGLGLGTGIFNVQYQFVLQNIGSIVGGNLLNYYMTNEHLQFMQDLLQPQAPIRYSRHVNKVYIDTDWSYINVGEFIIIEAYMIVDPVTYSDVWKDRWLQNYTTEKIKYQWGSNLTKFVGMTLPGAVQFNGEAILKDAEAQIAKMEDEMINSYGVPLADMIG